MRWLNSILATCQFEFINFLSLQRLAVSIILAGFPPVMLSLIFLGFQFSGDSPENPLFITLLFVSISCLLGMLLWATPNIYSELEGKSWIYVASRPRGRVSVILGKYLAAVLFGFVVCFVAITGCISATQILSGSLRSPVWVWFSMNCLYLIACASYGAVYSLIGTMFYRRAMVIAAAYTLLSGMFLANIPAVVSRLTLRYHLQFIGLNWFGNEMALREDVIVTHYLLNEAPSTIFHLACLGLVILVALGFAIWVVKTREYATSDET